MNISNKQYLSVVVIASIFYCLTAWVATYHKDLVNQLNYYKEQAQEQRIARIICLQESYSKSESNNK